MVQKQSTHSSPQRLGFKPSDWSRIPTNTIRRKCPAVGSWWGIMSLQLVGWEKKKNTLNTLADPQWTDLVITQLELCCQSPWCITGNVGTRFRHKRRMCGIKIYLWFSVQIFFITACIILLCSSFYLHPVPWSGSSTLCMSWAGKHGHLG